MEDTEGVTREGTMGEDETATMSPHTMLHVQPVTYWMHCLIVTYLRRWEGDVSLVEKCPHFRGWYVQTSS